MVEKFNKELIIHYGKSIYSKNYKRVISKLDSDKVDIDNIIKEIVAILKPDIPQLPDSIPEDSEDYTKITVSQLDGGLWLGDERMYDIIKNEVATIIKEEEITIERPVEVPGNTPSSNDSVAYRDAIKYYSTFWLGQKSTDTTLNNVIKGTDKYKIGVMVRYWCNRFGLDERLVYALMMQESSMNPYAATKSSAGGYGLMQCERGVYFNKTQTITSTSTTTQYPSAKATYDAIEESKTKVTVDETTHTVEFKNVQSIIEDAIGGSY